MSLMRTILLICALLVQSLQAVASEQQVVLVVSANSPLQSIDSLELRKIYLGFNVHQDGNTLSGLRNVTDDALNSVFYQNVAAMSERSYNRRMLSLTVRQGTRRPKEYIGLKSLIQKLNEDPYSVSYMWKKNAEQSPDVKILRVLWQQY